MPNSNHLGKGRYGDIYQTDKKDIVVKIQEIDDEDGISNIMLMESDILLSCQHPNIIKCLGVRSNKYSVETYLEKCEKTLGQLLPFILPPTNSSPSSLEEEDKIRCTSDPPVDLSSFSTFSSTLFSSSSSSSPTPPVKEEKREEKILSPLEKPKENKSKSKVILKWIYQIFSGLEYLHGKHIIHGDIKFDNIMIDKKGNIKIIDFGFSQRIFNNQTRRELIQSSWYRAPEVIFGDLYYDERVDMWSMGVVLMKMIFNYIISTVNDVCDQQGSSSSSDDDEKENTGLIKIISDYTSVFGIPEGESWKKLVNDYQEKLKKDEKKDEEKEKIDESSVFSILRTFLLPTESLDRSYAFQVWLKLNLGKSYSAALKLFGQADLDDLISIINSCLSLDPSKRAHSSSILQHPLFIRHGLCNSSTACGGFTSTSVPIAVDKEKEDSKEEKKEEKKQPVQQKEERREEKKRSVQQAQHFDFIKSNFLMMQELIGCHQNTIEIATDIAKRLLKNTEITRMLENGKLSPRTLGITILILAIKYNQGEIIYKVNLMSALVISILKLSEKDLRKVKLCEINLFNLIFNAGAGSSPQSYSPQMISEECRKKLNPFLNYFF